MDLISKQAAIDLFPDDDLEWDTNCGYIAPHFAMKMIKELPSAQPERTGRWIHDGYAFNGGIDWMHCSECGHKDAWNAVTRTPFCAWCGAKMEENKA